MLIYKITLFQINLLYYIRMQREVSPKLEGGKRLGIKDKHTYFPLWDNKKKRTKTRSLYTRYKKTTKTRVSQTHFKEIIHHFDDIVLNRMIENADGVRVGRFGFKIRVHNRTMGLRKGFLMKSKYSVYLQTKTKIRGEGNGILPSKRIDLYMSRKLIRDFTSKGTYIDCIVDKKPKNINEDFDYFDIFNDF